MSETGLARLESWLIEPMRRDVAEAVERLRRAPDVQHVAVMPDVHLATDVCIGVAVATSRLIYPQAVGGDIGCGMLAVAFDTSADQLSDPSSAGRVLAQLGRVVPARRRNRGKAAPLPDDLEAGTLSDARLEAVRRDEGVLAFGTLGSGNHFVELQADEGDRLWLMVHSGSRAIGPAIRDHHLLRAEPVGSGLRALDVHAPSGQAYLADAAWARRYAQASRERIGRDAGDVIADVLGGTIDWSTAISTDHNHVEHEPHGSSRYWTHRKGAMPAHAGVAGVLPGSMGSASYHVLGKGCAAALCSSAHGAGRLLSRTDARRRVSTKDLHKQMAGVWYDYRNAALLRDEAPGAYKDIRAVARAQRDLVKVTRVLRPVLSYKGT
jgi:tRNA-splicing ligase RtcB